MHISTMNMKIVNLTPHSLTLHGEGGSLTIPASGAVVRLAVTREALPALMVGDIELPVHRPRMGAITTHYPSGGVVDGLPLAEEGVVFVVSALVADAAKRADVMSPGELVRDAKGVIIGARGLSAFV
jgi:hypothetical protein